MRTLLIGLVFMAAHMAVADVYKTVDKNGRTIYTDSPKSDNAKKIELREINTVPSAKPLPITPTVAPTPQPADVQYNISIISPKHDVTIPPGQRDLAIAIQLNPALQEGHLLVYFMDGELLEETQVNNIIVKDVPRGSHVLVVEAMDANGKSFGTSAAVTVNIIRPIIKNAP